MIPQIQDQEMQMPVILAVDDDRAAISALERDLSRRFAADYRIVVAPSAEAGMQQAQQLRDEGADVALVIAGYRLRGMSGIDLLIAAHRLHPDARRVLMIVFGDAATADNAIAHARAIGQIDSYITEPWGSPEIWLYAGLTELLSEWAQTHLPQFEVVRLVGPRYAPESHHLRDVLDRSPVRYGFYADDSEDGRRLLQQHHLSRTQLPAAILADGRVLPRPSLAEIARALGARTRCPTGLYDVAIIGAGPAGLAAAVYAASEGLRRTRAGRLAAGAATVSVGNERPRRVRRGRRAPSLYETRGLRRGGGIDGHRAHPPVPQRRASAGPPRPSPPHDRSM